jgi:hypothetical protein
LVFQRQQGPHLRITTNDYVTATTAVTTVWTTLGGHTVSQEVSGSLSTTTALAVDFYVINEVAT